MALASEKLARQSIGPASIAGGVSFEDAFLIQPNESSLSENWRHRQGVLEFRDNLRSFLTFPGAALPTGPITRLDVANFRSAGTFLLALDKAHIWQWNGSGAVFTDITDSAITAGSDTAPWSSDTVLDAFFACNGANELIYWLGTGNAAKLNGAASYTANTGNPANLIGRYVVGFAGRVFLAFTTESGTAQGQRVRWCSDSDYFDWRSSQRRGAGAVDCSDTGGNITGLETLAQQLYVLKSDSIVIGRETGDIATPFAFPTSLKVGCIAGQSFKAINPQTGIFLGNDNVYRISGEQTDPIGDKIRKDLFLKLNQTQSRQIVSFVNPLISAYYLCIPLVGATEATRAYIYDYADERWYIETYPTKVHSASTILLGSGAQTWDATTGTWDAQGTAAWDSFQAGTTAPRIVIGTQFSAAQTITAASNTTPIVITTSMAHGLTTGDRVTIASVGGNTNANGNWAITVLTPTTFSLDTSAGNSNYTSGGTVAALWRVHTLIADGDFTDSASAPQTVQASLESKLFKLNEGNDPGAITVKGLWIFFTDASGGAITAKITVDGVGTQTSSKTFAATTNRIYLPFEITGVLSKITIQATARVYIRAVTMMYDIRS